MEIWKEIEGYENLYKVSSYGRVKSLARYISRIDKRGYSYKYKRKEKILVNVLRTNGYLWVGLNNNTELIKQCMVHSLVAKAFINNIENKKYVNHIDGNKQKSRC